MFCSSWSDRVVLDTVPTELDERLNNTGGWFNGVVGLENESCGPS